MSSAGGALRSTLGGLLLIGSGLLGMAGCGVAPPPSEFPTAADALTRMKATYDCANGVKGDGKIDHLGAQGRVRGEIYIFAVNPARVRIDVVSPFGPMLYTLTSNGKEFQLLDFREKQFLRGPATPCNLARLTQVPVPGHVLVSLLRGEAPLLKHQSTAPSLKWNRDGYYEVVVPGTRQAEQTLKLEVYDEDFKKPWQEQRLRVTELQTRQRGAVVYTAELRNFEPTKTAPPRVDEDGIDPDLPPSGGPCDREVPMSIRIDVPSTGDDVIFQYKEVAFNPPIPEGAFTQTAPAGVFERYVDDCRSPAAAAPPGPPVAAAPAPAKP